MIIGKINRFIVILFFVGVAFSASAQRVVHGRVYEKTTGNPLERAYIVAISSNVQLAYAFSDKEGRFELLIPVDTEPDILRVSMLGYKTIFIPYESDNNVTFAMEEQQLDIVASKVKASVIEHKGDTLSIVAGALSDGNEKTLADLLAKIPGLAVTESGGITHDGLYINKFYIEGLDLMGNRYGVVTKNLPADRVSRIEIYQHHQPVKVLQESSPSDRSAVNIILKSDARDTWLFSGDFAAGFPNFPLFEGRALLSQFGAHSQNLLLLKGNSIGHDILPELKAQSYFGRRGAFLVQSGSLDDDFSSELCPRRSELQLSKEYWFDNITGLGTINHLYKIGEDRSLRLFINLAAEQYGETRLSDESIMFEDGSELLISEQKLMSDRLFFVSGGALYEKNEEKLFFSDKLDYSFQKRVNEGVVSGYQEFGEDYNLPSVKVANMAEVVRQVKGHHVIGFTSDSKYVNNNHSAVFQGTGFSARQIFTAEDFSSDNTISRHINMARLPLVLSGGILAAYSFRKADLSGSIQDNGELAMLAISPHSALSSSLVYRNLHLWLSVPLSYTVLSFTGTKSPVIYPLCSPSIRTEYQISNHLDIIALVSYNLSRSSAASLLESSVMQNYRTISKSDSLRKTGAFNAEAVVKYSEYASMFFASLSSTFSSSSSDRTPESSYSQAITSISYLPIASTLSSVGVNGSLEKYFGIKTLFIKAEAGTSWTDGTQYLQGIALPYSTREFRYSLKFRFSPADWISANGITRYNVNHISGSSSFNYRSLNSTASLILHPLKKLKISMNCDYLWESIPSATVSNPLLMNAGVEYSFKYFTLFADCINLLDAKEYRREFIGIYSTRSSSAELRCRTTIAGIRMSF